MVRLLRLLPWLLISLLPACNRPAAPGPVEAVPAKPVYFQVDPATAGIITGTIRFSGAKPAAAMIDMEQDADCAKLHRNAPVPDEAVVVNRNGTLRNAFVYLKSGLEGKAFAPPAATVTIDQKGCWFAPRVLGIQTGQLLTVTNSDPVTHNIHPLAQVNREWNHSQAPEEAPFTRKFLSPEVMVRVKCNVHRWMRAWIGVLDHPYFAVTGADGKFELRNVPPGTYTVAAWQEKLGTQEQTLTVTPSGKVTAAFVFQGE
jgi:plastocyanin